MNCYFYIENFHCESTHADQCFEALKTRIRASATPDKERKYFDACAGWIYKKDTYRGAEAQALLHQQREKEKQELSNEITLFSRDIPSFDYENWQSFIQKKKDLINTFRLCRYLKERWNRLDRQEKYENIPQVEQIINLLKHTYPSKKNELHRSLKIVTSHIKSMKLKTEEDEIKKEIRTLKRAKKWEDLYKYISKFNTSGFSHDLIMLLTEQQRHAEEGMLWLQKKQKLDDLVKKSDKEPLDALEQEFLDIKEEIPDLAANQAEFGSPDAIIGIQQSQGQLSLNILNKIKNSPQSPEEKFRKLKWWENHLWVLKYPQPGEWNEYTEELNFEMAKVYSDDILKILNTLEDIHEIKQSVDRNVKETSELDLKEKIRDYIAEGKIVDIFEIQENIRELEEFDRSLERTITASDPFTVKLALSKQPGDFQGIPQAVLNKLTQKHQAIEDIIRFTTTTTDQLDLLVVSLQKESKNILFNNPFIKLEGFERQFEAIREKTTQVLDKYQSNYKFNFLENLEKITRLVNELLFPPRSTQRSPGAGKLSKHQFINSINENIAVGEAFNDNLQKLKSKIDDRVMEDPIAIQDKFFEIITVYKDKAFIFPKPAVKKVCKLYGRLVEIMHAKIDHYLKPLKNHLHFPFPLLGKDILHELREKTDSLLKQMDKIDLSFPGFEEFVEIYKDELEQWNRVIEIQEAVHEKSFDEAARGIKGIYEQDIEYPAQILVYYYRYLFQSGWKEDQWLNFFGRFSLDSIKANESGYLVILKDYKKEVRKNFDKLALSTIETHFKIFKTLFSNDDLLPYLSYLARQDTARDFFKNIKVENRPVMADVFKALVTMLENNKDWKRYMALYNQSPKKCQRYFEKPVEKVNKDLDQDYEALVEKFKRQVLEIGDIDAYIDKIPEGQEFLTYFAKSKKIKDLSDRYLEITRNFKSLENEDIWMQPDLYRRVGQLLEHHIIQFTDEFANITNNNNWNKRIASLKNIYDQGIKLKKQSDEMREMDVNYKIRAEEDYSKKLRNSIQELLNTWSKFRSEIDGLKENAIYKETFKHYYLKGFIEKWQEMSLYQLWVDEGNELPGSLDDYFKMWETVLETHNQFLTYYNNMKDKKKDLQTEDLDRIRLLDEFTRLTIERLKQQGKP
ncbi:MAG: hypothetical protein JSV88_29645 [Candidatus Aminicenantes bacterium]|nr:MAG: hypothetical protein JSV88_29645 [Candidatus Aminicenantes bacterium]